MYDNNDLERETYKAKRKLDVYLGIEEDNKKKLINALNWHMKMTELSILRRNSDIIPKRADIWLVDLGVNIGAEMESERPCIVVSYDTYNDKSDLATVIPITRAHCGHMTQFKITEECIEYVHDKIEGTVKAEQITTKSKLRFKVKIGELSEVGMDKLGVAMINHLVLGKYCTDDVQELLHKVPVALEDDNIINDDDIVVEDSDLLDNDKIEEVEEEIIVSEEIIPEGIEM